MPYICVILAMFLGTLHYKRILVGSNYIAHSSNLNYVKFSFLFMLLWYRYCVYTFTCLVSLFMQLMYVMYRILLLMYARIDIRYVCMYFIYACMHGYLCIQYVVVY